MIGKHKTANWIGISCANQYKASQQSGIVRHDQITLSNCSNIIIRDGNIGLLNVLKPTLLHGRTELVSQIVNSFCNCSTFLDPNMVWKTQLSANLSTICNNYNNINNINRQNNHNNSNNYNKVESSQ